MSLLIGINGEIGSGKSTLTDYLVRAHGMAEYAFAKPLKDIAVTLGFQPHQVFGTQEEKLETNEFWGISGRKFLQVFGSEVCRDYVPTVLPDMQFNDVTMWVRLFEKFRMDHPNVNTVVSDVRFADESQKIKQLGGYIIRVVRPTQEVTNMSDESNVAACTTIDEAEAKQHKSELQAASIKPNIVIRNDGSFGQLFERLETALSYIRMGMLRDPNAVIYL